LHDFAIDFAMNAPRIKRHPGRNPGVFFLGGRITPTDRDALERPIDRASLPLAPGIGLEENLKAASAVRSARAKK